MMTSRNRRKKEQDEMDSRWHSTGVNSNDYDARFAANARSGQDVHGEANFVSAFDITSVLDAGCGTGRIAIELARRGLEVAGADRDVHMLAAARQKAPHLEWYLEDLASLHVPNATAPDQPRLFDAIVMAGNVMIFLDPGTEAAVVANLARHLRAGGLLIAGFQLHAGGLDLTVYDTYAAQSSLTLYERWSTWDRQPWSQGSDYAVSVHRR
jgi:SAM-dependent methyltransferase